MQMQIAPAPSGEDSQAKLLYEAGEKHRTRSAPSLFIPWEKAGLYEQWRARAQVAAAKTAQIHEAVEERRKIRAAIARLVGTSGISKSCEYGKGYEEALERVNDLPELTLPEPKPEKWMIDAGCEILASILNKNKTQGLEVAEVIARHAPKE